MTARFFSTKIKVNLCSYYFCHWHLPSAHLNTWKILHFGMLLFLPNDWTCQCIRQLWHSSKTEIATTRFIRLLMIMLLPMMIMMMMMMATLIICQRSFKFWLATSDWLAVSQWQWAGDFCLSLPYQFHFLVTALNRKPQTH